jgi:hypothetical protein
MAAKDTGVTQEPVTGRLLAAATSCEVTPKALPLCTELGYCYTQMLRRFCVRCHKMPTKYSNKH